MNHPHPDVRHRFSKTMQGDPDGLFMANYEVIARYLGQRLRESGCSTILELCCGIGATTIPVAREVDKVIAVDNNPHRLKFAGMNADHWGVPEKIEFICADVTDPHLLGSIRADAVITDVDWAKAGDSKGIHTTDISQTQPPSDRLYYLITSSVSLNIAMRLSPRTHLASVRELNKSVEIQSVYISKGSMAKTPSFYYAYFGNLVHGKGKSELRVQI